MPEKLVGLAAIQVVKDHNGIAIATTRTSAKRQALLDAGADRVIVTEEENLFVQVQEITNGSGVDIAFDAVGGSFCPNNLPCLPNDTKVFQSSNGWNKSANRWMIGR